jgi:hypothetical protein
MNGANNKKALKRTNKKKMAKQKKKNNFLYDRNQQRDVESGGMAAAPD